MSQVSGVPHARQVDAHVVMERAARPYTKSDWAGWLVLALVIAGMLIFRPPTWLPLAVFAVWLPVWLLVKRPWVREAEGTDGPSEAQRVRR